MTETKEVFISVLKNYINNSSISIPPYANYTELFHLAGIHSVTGILAAMNRKYNLGFPDEFAKKLDAYMFSSVSMSVMWDKVYLEISSAMADNKIKNIVVKGPVVKRYYPDPDLRTMGDIDLIVHKDDMPRALKVMESLGFECEEGCVDENKFMRKNICVELHEDLTSKDFGTGIDYKAEMQGLFDNVKNPDEYIQELTEEYHLIYLLLHAAQHLISEGCGVRQIMDIALTLKNAEINFDLLWKELDRIKLTDFAHCIFYLCNKWFDIKYEDFVMDKEIYEALSNHILDGGVFGHAVDRQNNLILRESMYDGNKIQSLLKRIFPDINEARSKVIWFRNKPVILLPIAWIYRWYDMCRKNPQRVRNYFKSLGNKTDNEISEEYKMLQAMGFYKE